MTESKTECSKCGASILQTTADQNNGRCKPCATGPRLEGVAEGMNCGMRILLGFFFAVLIGGLAYGIGSFFGMVGSIILAIPFALIGFIYGCFCVEINTMIRSVVPFMLDH